MAKPNLNICPVCMSYMLQHMQLSNWTKCVTCGYCVDENGENLLTSKENDNENDDIEE